ncbi:MAG: hypothetical protein HY689_10330 [Chloroflexi bacterium]|nr:hypothetical protein [Chloroflexota bacterium]
MGFSLWYDEGMRWTMFSFWTLLTGAILLTACTSAQSQALPASMPATVPMARAINQVTLASYRRVANASEFNLVGEPPVYVVDRDLTVRVQVQHIQHVDILVKAGPKDVVLTVPAVADTQGHVEVRLRLPQTGVVYAIQAQAQATDPSGRSFSAIAALNRKVVAEP